MKKLIYIYTQTHTHIFGQSSGAVEYTDCTSADPPASVLDMTLNNLMVKFQ